MPAIRRSVNLYHAVGAAAVAAFGLLAPAALADNSGTSGPPVFSMTWDASGDQLDPFTYNPTQYGSIATTFGTWTLGGDPSGIGGPLRERTGWRYRGGLTNTAWNLTWDCVTNPDPYVDATINVTNTSSSTQTFWIYMPLLIAPAIPGGTLMDGFVSAVVSDQDFSGGALLSATTVPIYQGYIDTAALGNATMWSPGYSLLAPPFGAASDNDSFLNRPGPAANTEIALRLQFELSPGDSASVTGTFEIRPIPGPAGLSLLAIVGAVATRRRRR